MLILFYRAELNRLGGFPKKGKFFFLLGEGAPSMRKCTTFFLTVLLVLGAAASAQAEGLTPLDVANLKLVGGIQLSPDGRYVAYTVSEPRDLTEDDFKNGPARSVLHLYDAKTQQDRVFIGNDEKLSSVHWTADSRSLTFLSAREGDDKKKALYKIAVDGGEAKRVLSHKNGIRGYSLSPDGRQVAFLCKDAKPEVQEKREKKGFNAEVFEEDWRFSRLYVGRLGSSTSSLSALPVEGHVSEVHWSPKKGDNRLLLVAAPNPSVDASLMYKRVHIVNTKGRVTASIKNPGKLGHIAWSPDASKVALTAGVDINDPDNANLFVADSKTGSMKDLTKDVKGRADDFAWNGNGSLRVAMSFGADSKLMEVSTSGALSEVEANPSRNYLKVANAGSNLVYVADSSTHPRELFLNGKRITNSNPWLKNKTLSKQELITYKTRDGLEIEGMLIRPLPGTTTGPAPLILVVHGGPESHYDDGWLTYYSMPGQVGAAKGYAVFYPNYRGSTGRGVAFTKSSQGDPAGKEFEDLIDAIDHLIAKGVADPKKIGVTGGSYGGYATGWMSTRYTDRFAAGVMFVGISDKVSKVGTTDIPDEEFLVHARKRPWDAFDFFAKRSPIRYVKQARTPLLIMHGKEDPRVHPTQSMELFRFLKVLNQTPVRLVLFPGEGHGNRKAAARYDYNLRMLRWFDHYLKGPGGEKPPLELDYNLPK